MTIGTQTTRRGLAAGLLLGALAATSMPFAGATHAAGSHAKATINIGNKGFTEQFIIADMYQLVLEKHGFKVNQKNLGETPITNAALQKGSIDLYPEYTGTGLTVVLNKPSISDPIQAYDTVKNLYQSKFHDTWLEQSPMNDTNAIAMKSSTAAKYNVHTLADLGKAAGKLSFAELPACANRPDCLIGMKQKYGIHFKSVRNLTSQSLLYAALQSGQADVIEVFSTDSQIKQYKLTVAQDPKSIFPADHIAPVVRTSILRKYPQIRQILNQVTAKITTKAQIKLNAQVSVQHKDPMAVARAFLTKKGLL